MSNHSIPVGLAPADLDALSPLAELIASRVDADRTAVIGMAGGVAVGKSTVAESLRRVLRDRLDLECPVVSSDGFLFSNEELIGRGIFDRKGFPESYDGDAIEAFVAMIRRREFPITVPVYDHLTHDVLSETTTLEPSPVLLLEGVNMLNFASVLDLAIYVDAPEPLMRRWYLERVVELRRRSAHEPSAFFAAFIGLTDEEFAVRAESIWESVNLPNLLEHIEPTRGAADVVITKGPDHSIESVTVR